MKEEKKVWIFHPDASDPNLNGLPRPHKFGDNILLKGYRTVVFSSSQFRHSKSNLIKDGSLYKYIDGKVPFYYVKSTSFEKNDRKRVINWLSYYFNLMKLSRRLIKKGDKPDVIIGSSPHPMGMLAAVRIGKKFNIPVINEIRDFWPEVFFLGGKVKEKSLIGKVLLWGEKYIYTNSSSLIFLKEGDYQYIVDRKWDRLHSGPIDLNKCYYINNGVDLDEFYSNQNSYVVNDTDLDSASFKVVYTGGIRKVNDLDKVLNSAKLLSEKDVIFLIYGDGDHKSELEKRIKNEKIDNVKLKGHIKNKYIPYILSKASVTLLNYSQENYNWSRGNSSNKLFEYMAAGKPIISSVKMGFSIIDKYNCGVEVDIETPEKLSETIMLFKEMDINKLNKIGENGKRGALDFDYKYLSNKLVSVIEKTIGDNNG